MNFSLIVFRKPCSLVIIALLNALQTLTVSADTLRIFFFSHAHVRGARTGALSNQTAFPCLLFVSMPAHACCGCSADCTSRHFELIVFLSVYFSKHFFICSNVSALVRKILLLGANASHVRLVKTVIWYAGLMLNIEHIVGTYRWLGSRGGAHALVSYFIIIAR